MRTTVSRRPGAGVHSPDVDGKGQMLHPAPTPTQEEVEALVARASKHILRYLQRRGVVTVVTAPGDGEVTVVADETMGEKDPLLARLLAAATAGAAPAGPANERKAIRIVLDPDDRPVAKGNLCAQARAFNLHAATRVAANDKQGRLTLCRYILRPPGGSGAARPHRPPRAAGPAPPKRHLVRYFGVLSSHAASRSQVVPAPAEPSPPAKKDKPAGKSRNIPWAEPRLR